MRPPLLHHRVRRHRFHIGIEVDTDVLEVGDQQVPVAKNGVVADVGFSEALFDARPDPLMEVEVLIGFLGAQPDDLSMALWRCRE